MDFHVEDQEASRLKEILFPKRTRASRSTVKSFYETGKENTHHNNRTFNLRTEINRLKKGMQNFLDNQGASPDNCLTTPRQCLEIIKLMSDSIQNYGQEIQEAANTLIENIPTCFIPISQSKYYMLHLKFNLLHSSHFFMRRRILSDAFSLIKQESQEVHQILSQRQRKISFKQNKKEMFRMLNLSSALNEWRCAVYVSRKKQIEDQELCLGVEEQAKKISLLSDQSRLVLWLQKSMQGDSDACEILIFNPKNATLRTYINICNQDVLSSVFETVEDQSHAEQGLENRGKIKRIQFNLDHSLTKICLVKRQCLRVDQIRRDPDYSKIDNLAATHGLSARQMVGGAIFTPLLNQQGQSIGIIRQYYFDKPGSLINSHTAGEISQVLQRGIKTNEIIEAVKEKSQGIRKQYYLKSIQLMNQISTQQNILTINSSFQKLLCDSFPVQAVKYYNYETVSSSLSDRPKFIITTNKGSQVDHIQLISALSKMHEAHSYFVFEENRLVLKTTCMVYVLDLMCTEEGVQQYLPVILIKHLVEHKQACVMAKIQQQNSKSQQLQKTLKREEKDKQESLKKQILKFCLNCSIPKSISEVITQLQAYCDAFYSSSKAKVAFKIANKTENYETEKILYQNLQFKIVFKCQNKNNLQDFQFQTIQNLTDYLVTTLLKPNLVNTSNIDLVAHRLRKVDEPLSSILELISEITQTQKETIQTHQINQNPFQTNFFITYIQIAKLPAKINTVQMVKTIRKYSQADRIQTEPLATILYLDETLLLKFDKYIQMKQDDVSYLSQLYGNWKLTRSQVIQAKNSAQRDVNVSKGVGILHRSLLPNLRSLFSELKFKTKGIFINQRLFESYIHRNNICIVREFFHKIYEHNRVKKSKLAQAFSLVSKTRTVATVLGARQLFNKWKSIKKSQKCLKNILIISRQGIHRNLDLGFKGIYFRREIVHTNNFSRVQRIFLKRTRTTFEAIRKFSQRSYYSELTENDSDCSKISKIKNYIELSKLLNEKYPNYQMFVQLKNQHFLKLDSTKLEYVESLPLNSQTQYIQFICSSQSPIKHVLWLIPPSTTISLLEKHYLQALSKSIEESFKKFVSKSQLMFFFINHFQQKTKSLSLQRSLNLWRNNALKAIKKQEYYWRQAYYETNVEVENLKTLEKQNKREEEERLGEMSQMIKLKNSHEANLNENRKSIVRLQISSRRLQEEQFKQKYLRNISEMKRAFSIWRVQSNILKKQILQVKNIQKIKQYGFKFFKRTVEQKQKDHLRSALKMIFIKCADIKARNKSEKKRRQKDAIEDRDLNRLMTFQDEFEIQELEKSRQTSIIPISFKQFSASQKQNNEISEEQARRMNGGAYKLNQKTLKFLKRMGKISAE